VQPPPWAPPRGLLPAPAPRPALPAPLQPPTLPAPPVAAQQGCGEGNQRRLTPDEMAERRRLGLCFNCNEKYTRGHNRFCRRIFFLDGVEIEDAAEAAGVAENDDEAPCFSLQAVAGVPMAGTMQIAMALGVASFVALLDSGSTHNIISEEAARRSGLPLRQCPCLTALVANGERVTCAGIIRDAPLLIDDDSFPADLYVMPLAGYDVVLGTRWLSELGPWPPAHVLPAPGAPHLLDRGGQVPRADLGGNNRGRSPIGGAAALIWGALHGPRRSATQASARPPHYSQARRPAGRRPSVPVPRGAQG
jgi:hypothetical protein